MITKLEAKFFISMVGLVGLILLIGLHGAGLIDLGEGIFAGIGSLLTLIIKSWVDAKAERKANDIPKQ